MYVPLATHNDFAFENRQNRPYAGGIVSRGTMWAIHWLPTPQNGVEVNGVIVSQRRPRDYPRQSFIVDASA